MGPTEGLDRWLLHTHRCRLDEPGDVRVYADVDVDGTVLRAADDGQPAFVPTGVVRGLHVELDDTVDGRVVVTLRVGPLTLPLVLDSDDTGGDLPLPAAFLFRINAEHGEDWTVNVAWMSQRRVDRERR